ncbi:MAG: hypothetical protein ACRD00_02905 [Thermoanaerobaculia bacterium]
MKVLLLATAIADLLLLNLDPLTDIRNVRAIRAIYKAGVRVSPSSSP